MSTFVIIGRWLPVTRE